MQAGKIKRPDTWRTPFFWPRKYTLSRDDLAVARDLLILIYDRWWGGNADRRGGRNSSGWPDATVKSSFRLPLQAPRRTCVSRMQMHRGRNDVVNDAELPRRLLLNGFTCIDVRGNNDEMASYSMGKYRLVCLPRIYRVDHEPDYSRLYQRHDYYRIGSFDKTSGRTRRLSTRLTKVQWETIFVCLKVACELENWPGSRRISGRE